ncbi:membrane protein [Salmonella enterica subsp. enterica]|uniref:Membrane protein n=1 Tax=Salmonella enterica I TaxID=59201 RepID=A0A3S4FIJ7_SALET|nr:membrane protein [Salmonella enterica subsp. enterica]
MGAGASRYPRRRNGLPTKGVELVFKLDDDKRRYLAQQVKKELA